jgi:predicted Zn-dependent peptidase
MTQAKLDTQRLVVLNERRQSYENRPYGCADLAVAENLFPAGHPYSWDTIGSPKDLEAASVGDVKRFFATWYVPNNATMTVVGDVDPAQVFQMVRRYFGFLPKKPLPPRLAPAPVSLKEEKRIALTDKVKVPKLVMSWISPAGYAPGDADCDLLGSILAQGKASRLYERLVHKDSLATEVYASQDSRELQGIFQIDVLAQPGRTLADIQSAVDEELAQLVAEGPSAAEVESARGHRETNLAKSLESFQRRALQLADYAVHLGNPNALGKDLDRYRSATPASIQAMARRLFIPGRLVVTVEPAATAKEGGDH